VIHPKVVPQRARRGFGLDGPHEAGAEAAARFKVLEQANLAALLDRRAQASRELQPA
jgi:hypothetical protein